MDIFESLSGVFSCMLMIGLGYWLTHRGWFTAETGRLFSRMAMTIAIPLYMIVSMTKSYTKQDLLQAGTAAAVPILVMLTVYAIGVVVSFAARVPEHRRGAFQAMFFVSNSGFIGFPVNVALFGEAALPYAVIYYLLQTMLFWTIGVWSLSLDGPRFAGLQNGSTVIVPRPVFGLSTLRNIVTPPLIGSVVAVVLILGSIKLPTFLASTFTYLGGMTTPLAMLFLGIAIHVSNLKSVRMTRDMWILIAARFLIAPGVVILVTSLIPVPELMRKVYIIEAAMPVMTQVSIAARAYNADANYIAVMTAITTVMGLFTIPTYFLLLQFGIL
ncbi:AEC family transporter [Rhodoplanes sp. TEM]|uniref:AEC family transporter n=1 Tax=Rhodoplanes tepidamans TaxID=200616 RepID=A0ABT5J5Q2_RHOTP|nr:MULTISPECIES: AEC family transporter [Rhodoplanes]MDC7784964.1 AEC family transporter [Rhodoplanes tepidamans]MDC7985832.1 AEC family transporter [Rhodoplanes sp. TEM]MDQ0353807.1 putative permease [Rhodoplanes tepidamans]